MASDSETEDANFVEMILSNLFRKESNGNAIEFFLRRKRLGNSENHPQLENKLKKLKDDIEKCGGCLGDGPSGCNSIELAFPEDINNFDEIDSDIFKADYIDECIKCGELLDLENFRLGKSPYSSIDINMIMQGHHSWDSVSRTSPQKGRKLPDFGPPLVKSPNSPRSNISGKKGRRVEYSIEEDLAIIKFLLAKNLYDKVGGNATWKIVHREFPNHSYQSLHNRFRRFILPNLSKYKGITNGERNLFNRVVSSDSSSVSSPKKTIQADICSSIRNSPSTAQNTTSGVEQETVLASTSVKEKVSGGNPEEVIRKDADNGINIQTSLNKLGESLLLRIEDADMEDIGPLTPSTMEMILCNLFRKESNGSAIDFYMRQNQFSRFENSEELGEKCRKLKDQIEKCGGFLGDIPTSCHSIELVFPEVVGDITEIESDVFNAEYVEACVKCGDLLDIEDFRLGESPYNGSINFNSIMKGNDSWDSVTRKNQRKGRKLPDLGCSSEAVKEISPDKKIRNEYLMEEDLAILKFLVSKNLHAKVGGKATWRTVQREFPNHSFQSLRNRFSRHILPNLDKYESLTNSERNLFRRGSSTDDSCTSPPKPTLRSDILHDKSQDNFPAADGNLNSEMEADNPVSIPAASELPKIVIDESSRHAVEVASNSARLTVSSTKGEKTKKKCVREFTAEVDRSILKYIVTHKRYAEVFGTKLWMDIQATILKKRDWKSIKRRFHDVIVQNLESDEYSLDRGVILKLSSKKFSSSSEEHSSFDEDDCSASPFTKKRKSRPRPYSFEEDKLIIDYIVGKKRYEEIRGKRLWVDIQEKVLHEYDRTWESAKNRFLRTLYKNLQKFSLDPDIIAKFQHGAVVERHLGGVKDRRNSRKEHAKKNIRVAQESEEDPLPKHPALSPSKIATPAKKPKRQLFRQPIIPLPVIFTCEPGPVLTKKKDGSSIVIATKPESAAATANDAEKPTSPEPLTSVTAPLARSPAKSPSTSLAISPSISPAISPKNSLTASPAKIAAVGSQTSSVRGASSHSLTVPKKLRPAPSIRCEVRLTKLTKTELEKYGCKAQEILSSPTRSDPPVVIPSATLHLDSPPNASRFTVEISPDLFAARLSAAGSSMSVVAQASQESGWLPLASSLSREPLRYSSQPLMAFNENSSCTTALNGLNKFQQPSSVTGTSLNIESCEVNVEPHSETDVLSQGSLSAKTKTCHPIRTKVHTRSYLDLSREDLSSDGYRTPEG